MFAYCVYANRTQGLAKVAIFDDSTLQFARGLLGSGRGSPPRVKSHSPGNDLVQYATLDGFHLPPHTQNAALTGEGGVALLLCLQRDRGQGCRQAREDGAGRATWQKLH